MSSVDDCDSGLLELKGIGGCSVGNLFVACLELSMFVSIVIGIFLTGNLSWCGDRCICIWDCHMVMFEFWVSGQSFAK